MPVKSNLKKGQNKLSDSALLTAFQSPVDLKVNPSPLKNLEEQKKKELSGQEKDLPEIKIRINRVRKSRSSKAAQMDYPSYVKGTLSVYHKFISNLDTYCIKRLSGQKEVVLNFHCLI